MFELHYTIEARIKTFTLLLAQDSSTLAENGTTYSNSLAPLWYASYIRDFTSISCKNNNLQWQRNLTIHFIGILISLLRAWTFHFPNHLDEWSWRQNKWLLQNRLRLTCFTRSCDKQFVHRVWDCPCPVAVWDKLKSTKSLGLYSNTLMGHLEPIKQY